MSNEKVTVAFQLTQRDFFDFNRLMNQKATRIMLFYGLAVLVLIVVLEYNKEQFNAVPVFLGLVLIGGAFGITYYRMYAKSKKSWSLSKAFHDKIKIEFDDAGFVCSSRKNTATVPWNKVKLVLESNELVVIVLSETQAYMIPKTCDHVDDMKKLICTRVDPKICKLKVDASA